MEKQYNPNCFQSYTRVCKYCNTYFKTPFKFGETCKRCKIKNETKRRILIKMRNEEVKKNVW